MKRKRALFIRRMWDEIEFEEPDISTEQLAARVADACQCDESDVFDALYDTKDLDAKP